MNFKAKYYLLIAGIVSAIVSFLFFGRKHNVYNILLGTGITIFCVSFLWIVVSKDSFKRKLLWTGIVIVCAGIYLAIEPLLIETSYRIYLAQHEQQLVSINNILRNKRANIFIMGDSVHAKEAHISELESLHLLKAKEKVGAYMISKDQDKIYYGLWGFLDVRIGITYSLSGKKTDGMYHHLKGNWFH